MEKMVGEVPCNRYETTVAPTSNPTADPNRDTDGNGTADECEEVTQRTGAGGSRCDVFKRKCTLPYRTRIQKTIPWYVNGDTGSTLFEATNWAVQEWDLALKAAIQTARLVECRKTGGGEDCDNQYPMWRGQQDDYDDAVRIARLVDACARERRYARGACDGVVDDAVAALAAERSVGLDDLNIRAIAAISKAQPALVLCHNPVIDGDHPVCGPRGLAPRQGDLRYNTVLAIEKPQTPSAWGIMVDADDPITGEKVASSINIWTHITDIAAQQLLDLVLYMNGEITTQQVTDGEHVHNWVMAQRAGGAGAWPTMSQEEVHERLAAPAQIDGKTFARIAATPRTPEIRSALNSLKSRVRDVAAHAKVPSTQQAMAEARMNLARGTPTEAKLINPAMLQVAGIPGHLPVTGEILKMASPLGLNNPKLRSLIQRAKENALARRGACILHEAPEPSGLTAIADIMKKKFPAVDGETAEERHNRHLAMFRYLQRRYHYAVLAHEMGHSVGHRHNFVSSSGALHYRPQYWQLRTKNGTVTDLCTGPKDWRSTPKNCVGPRYFDPLTSEEQDQLIWMWMQSSAMDYPGDVSQDMLGLGIWDFATTRAVYGDTVAVYSDPEIRAGSPLGMGVTDITDTFGGLLGIKYSIGTRDGTENFHYTQLQKNYKVLQSCYPVTPEQPSWWREEIDGIWDPVLDGHYVAVNGVFSKCRQMPVDYVAWNDLRPATADEGVYTALGFELPGPSVDPNNRLRVPYHFATDHWADLGNVSVFRHDNGADPYEQAMFIINTQENRHIFDNFRRNRTTFNPRSAADRSFSRYNEKLVNIAGGMAFLAALFRISEVNDRFEFRSFWPFLADYWARENMVAASVSFDHLTRQISRPEEGGHYYRTGLMRDDVLRSEWDPDGDVGTTMVIVPNGATGFLRDVGFGGSPIENRLSVNQGDYSVDYTITAGSYYNKINAFLHMSLSEDRFISQSRGDFYDARFRANGLADLFPDGFRRIVANTLVNDRRILAAHLVADPQTNAPNRPRVDSEMYPARPIGWTSWWPTQGPVVCFATDGRNICTPPDGSPISFAPEAIPYTQTAKIDPQVGWEVQKFAIAYVLAYIGANQVTTDWVDMMRVYRLGTTANPEIPDNIRIEWQDPASGEVYYARRYGKECLFHDKATCPADFNVEKGIAARVLEYANFLTEKGYKNTGRNAQGRVLVVRHPDGTPVVAADPAIRTVTPDGYIGPPREECDRNLDPNCTPLTVDDNRWATELRLYKSVPDYLWEVVWRFQLGGPHQLGLYP
jgi:hypothetical protein